MPLGPALVSDGGVQAVIAMTEQVGLETAQQFASQFYARLFAHGLVDLATNEARESVRGQWDWGAPVLVSGLENNQLLDFPIGGIYSGYLSHSERAVGAIKTALNASFGQDDAQQVVSELDALIAELSNSHKLLAALGDPFRRSGRDPQTFAKLFEDFYYPFKSQYDSQDWVQETTSCRRINDLRMAVMPRLSRLLDKTAYAQLDAELCLLGSADNDTLQGFRTYLGEMNTVVEQIWALLNAGKVDDAIKVKLDFEAQMSHSLDANKEALAQMSKRIGAVSAA